MLYCISDPHFNHDREFIYGPRGYHSVEEMNNTQIYKWNSTVTKNDTVIVAGDFFLGADADFVRKTIPQLNGSIHLIRGNHDTNAKLKIYAEFPKIIDVKWADMIEYNGRKYFITHFPTLTATLESDPNRCIYNLSGHTHSKDKFYEDRPYVYNVAVDAHGGYPVSIEQIHEDINQKIKECLDQLD